MTDYTTVRRNMVDSQIRPNKVTDPALVAAMSEVPREAFVAGPLRGIAYVDEDIKVAKGRYLMEPMVLARLVQFARVRPDDLALDVGCATGYSTAILARLCKAVIGLESDKPLADQATATLTELDVDNAAIVEGPLNEGYPRQGPYDVILFSGAIAGLPDGFESQLADGGRIVAVINNGAPLGKACVFLSSGGVVSCRPVFDAGTPLLPGFAKVEEFIF